MDLFVKLNLLLLDGNDFFAPGRVKLADRRFLQLRDVIGLEKDKTFRAGVVGGRTGTARVVEFSESEAVLDVELSAGPPAGSRITLVCALPRPQTFHKVLHCAITMGVKEIYFIHARKVEKSYWDASVLAPQAVDKEIRLALEQCGDTIYPSIEYRKRFKPFVEDELPLLIEAADYCCFGHPRAVEKVTSHAGENVVLVVGPEGGFNEFENQLLASAGVTPVTLGDRVLRTEFALAALLARLN